MLIYVASDSIGETGTTLIRAAISQFDIPLSSIKRFPFVRSTAAIDGMFAQMQKEREGNEPVLIVFTLVEPQLNVYMKEMGAAHNIVSVDILGGLVSTIEDLLGAAPQLKVGLTHRTTDPDYYRRIAAVEYAIKTDDGRETQNLEEADVILTGVSRTSKTPLCMYLAHQGIKAANVPLVPLSPVPEGLYKMPKFKIIGLMIKPQALHDIRLNRLHEMGASEQSSYAELGHILSELDFAQTVMRKIGCPVIDVTGKAVEETAGKIMQIIQRR